MIFTAISLQNIIHIASIAWSTALSLIGITSIIVFHEFGHFIFCKLFGVYTPTFSIGIGKKLFIKLIGDTEFCLSASPLGGYVEIATEDTAGKKGFNSLHYIKKCLIMLGGISFNMIFAYVILSALFYIGMPDSAFMPYENSTPTIEAVAQGSINQSELTAGDVLLSINNTAINNKAEIIKAACQKALEVNQSSIPATIERNGESHTITLHIDTDKKSTLLEQRLQVQLVRKPSLSLQESVTLGIRLTNFYIVTIFNSIKELFSVKTAQSLVGPIMTLAASTKVAQKGFKSLLIFLAIISINLGIMNLLPLPIFDGGQFVIFTIETIMRREMSERVKEAIGAFSWFLVLGLMAIFSIKDIYTLIHQYIL